MYTKSVCTWTGHQEEGRVKSVILGGGSICKGSEMRNRMIHWRNCLYRQNTEGEGHTKHWRKGKEMLGPSWEPLHHCNGKPLNWAQIVNKTEQMTHLQRYPNEWSCCKCKLEFSKKTIYKCKFKITTMLTYKESGKCGFCSRQNKNHHFNTSGIKIKNPIYICSHRFKNFWIIILKWKRILENTISNI